MIIATTTTISKDKSANEAGWQAEMHYGNGGVKTLDLTRKDNNSNNALIQLQ
jgi:hypothetical protein